MTQQDIYETWAPADSEWSQWVKPVLFAHLPLYGATTSTDAGDEEILTKYVPHNDGASALVLDLPGAMAVQMTGVLVRQRYRPIPLYNSCPPPKSWPAASDDFSLSPEPSLETRLLRRPAVDVQPILDVIVAITPMLQAADLPHNAPPAFLLDSKRRVAQLGYFSRPGAFDNRSVSLPTDFPSSNFLLSRGIRKVVLLQLSETSPQADLSHTLLRWQNAGISIVAVALDRGAVGPQGITVRRPALFRMAFYSLLARFGLKSNPLGGFGGVLPESGGIG